MGFPRETFQKLNSIFSGNSKQSKIGQFNNKHLHYWQVTLNLIQTLITGTLTKEYYFSNNQKVHQTQFKICLTNSYDILRSFRKAMLPWLAYILQALLKFSIPFFEPWLELSYSVIFQFQF